MPQVSKNWATASAKVSRGTKTGKDCTTSRASSLIGKLNRTPDLNDINVEMPVEPLKFLWVANAFTQELFPSQLPTPA